MTATRPITTPNLYFAPPCAKPADHHDTPHKDGRLFNATQKKEPRRALKRHIANKDRSPQRERRARSGRSHAVCIGRGGVVTAQRRRSTTASWGRFCFRRSRAGTAPFRVVITTALFAEPRFFHAYFFCVMFWVRAAAGGLFCVTWPRGQWACRQMWRLSEDRGGRHRSCQHHDHTAKRRSQIDAFRLTSQPSPPPATPALRRTRTGPPLDAKR